MCFVWESQAIGYWVKNISNLTTFADNTRLLHRQTGFSSKKDVEKRKEICHSVLAIHKSYPEWMRLYWSIYLNENKTAPLKALKVCLKICLQSRITADIHLRWITKSGRLNPYGFLNRNYVKTIQHGTDLESTRDDVVSDERGASCKCLNFWDFMTFRIYIRKLKE